MKIKTYRLATQILHPFIMTYIAWRKHKGKEDIKRFKERLGFASLPRPNGKIIWMHGASVGETVSMLPLINEILTENKDINIMVTSGTVTSAEILKNRLPERAFHQYIPIDCPAYAERFLHYWKPSLALWFESDFWPNLLAETNACGVPLVLLNGRISDHSFIRWQKHPAFMKEMQEMFTLSLGQTEEDARRLKVLGANNSACVGNIKYAAAELPCDEAALADLREKIGKRPCWIAGSTHKGEETNAFKVHKELKKLIPDILTIIIPRHPKRGSEIEEEAQKESLKTARRSQTEEIALKIDVYIADTIGEMGLFYRLAEIVFIGGSMIPHGGQNFLEPARLDSAVIVGKYMHNFAEMTQKALQSGAITQVSDEVELKNAVLRLLNEPKARNEQIQKAKEFALHESMVLERIMQQIKVWIDKSEK